MLALLSIVVVLALPRHGVLQEGQALGDVKLGQPRAAVVAQWGNDFGVCRGCPAPTLYWNFRTFEPQGAGVTFRRGRAVAVFTLWSPTGWRTSRGLVVGDNAALATDIYGALPRTHCVGYDALTIRRRRVTTAIYVSGETVWGFGVMRASEPVCR